MVAHPDSSASLRSPTPVEDWHAHPMLQSEHRKLPVDMQERPAASEREGQLRSTDYLFVGTIVGFIALLYSILINAVVPDELHLVNMYGEPFPSGNRYQIRSVSEMVHDPSTPRGMVWYAFGLLALAFFVAAWYPYRLSNVYLPHGIRIVSPWCSFRLSFAAARTLVPSVSMLCVILVQHKPENLYDAAQWLLAPVHVGGSVAFIVGCSLFEIYTLLWGRSISFAAQEQTARWVCAVGALLGGLLHTVGLLTRANSVGLCCDDVYRPVDMEAVRRARAHGLHTIAHFDLELMSLATLHPNASAPVYHGLYDTASSWGLALKLIGFWGEVSAAVFVLLGHLAIWYFCQERHAGQRDPVDVV